MKPTTIACVILSAAFLASCGALGGPTPDQVATQVADILADQVVSQDELEALKATLRASTEAAQQTDWATMLATAGGTVLASLLGVKLIPSKSLQGPFDHKA